MAVKTLSTNPLVVTSADTFTTVAATEARVRILGCVWDPGASGADGDTVAIAHGDGAAIWSATLRTGELGERAWFPGYVFEAKGLAITPPTHGTLYVYLADSYA